MTTPQFVDISQFQGNIDWQTYKAWSKQGDGVSRVAMRSSYGVGYIDAHFNTYRLGALAAGIDQIIYYHYAYPSLNNPVAEANSQCAIVGSMRPQDMVILDFEENVNQATSAWALSWLGQQEANYGKLPGLYASSAYIMQRLQDSRLARYPLWLANWQFTPDERPTVPAPWTSYEFVQYSDKANVPGVGIVDADIFLGIEQPKPEVPVTIDLTNGAVANFFKGDSKTWTCIQTSFTLHGEILAFYQGFGGNSLCGLTHLGLPLSNEIPVPNHPGVVNQEFERGAVRFDPDHVIDNPPGAGRVYKIHFDQDPRVTTLQGEIAKLQALPIVANLTQIQTVGQTIKDDVDLIMKLAQVQ